MKRVGIGIVVVALLYLSASWAVGFLVQSRMTIKADELRAKAPYLTIKSQSFDHGLFHSSETTVMSFSPAAMMPPGTPKVGNLGFEVTLKNRITHGPICGLSCFALASIDTTVELPPAAQSVISRMYGTETWLSLRTRLDFLGGSVTDISSPPVADAKNGGDHFSSEGFSGAIRASSGANEIRLEGSLPRVVFLSSSRGRFELQALTFKSVSHKILPDMLSTNFDIGIERMDMEATPGSTISIQKLSYSGQSPVSGGYSDMILKFDTGAISSPSANLKAAHLDITFGHLKLEALQAFNKAMQDFNAQLQGASPADRQAMLAKLKEPTLALLAGGAEIKLDRVGLETDTGAALLNGALHFNNLSEADFSGDNPWKSAMAKADGAFEVAIDDAAVAALPGPSPAEQLQKFADQGLFTHANGRWSTSLRFAGGSLTANGKPIGPPSGQPARAN